MITYSLNYAWQDPLVGQSFGGLYPHVPLMLLKETLRLFMRGEPPEQCFAQIPETNVKSHLAVFNPAIPAHDQPHDSGVCCGLCSGQAHARKRLCRFCKIDLGQALGMRVEKIGLLTFMDHLEHDCTFLKSLGQDTHRQVIRLFESADRQALEDARERRHARQMSKEESAEKVVNWQRKRSIVPDFEDSDESPTKRAAVLPTPGHHGDHSQVCNAPSKPMPQPPSSSPSVRIFSSSAIAGATRSDGTGNPCEGPIHSYQPQNVPTTIQQQSPGTAAQSQPTSQAVPVVQKRAAPQVKDAGLPLHKSHEALNHSPETSTPARTNGSHREVPVVDREGRATLPISRAVNGIADSHPTAMKTASTAESPSKSANACDSEQETADWPEDLLPFVKLLAKAGVKRLDELTLKVPAALAEDYVDFLHSMYPADLPNMDTAWNLMSAIEVAYEERHADEPDDAMEGSDTRFPVALNPYVRILIGLGVPSMESLFKRTPFARIGKYVQYMARKEQTKHLLPDMTTQFTFEHALKRAYKEAGAD